MSFKQEKVSMPMSSAGIVGFSSDMKIAGFEMDPKTLVIVTFVFVIVVKIADMLVK
jgi:preprotein translocase subunit Sec61beta